jgi:hypothetical protein
MLAGFSPAGEFEIGTKVAYQVSSNAIRYGSVIELDPRTKDTPAHAIRYCRVRVEWEGILFVDTNTKFPRKGKSWVRTNNLSITSKS